MTKASRLSVVLSKKVSIYIANEIENRLLKPEKDTKPSISFIPNITKTIGRGEDARNSFIYLTIRYAFIASVIITILCVLNHWFFRKEEKIPNITDDIQIVWDIAVPLITLALGYAFGRAKD